MSNKVDYELTFNDFVILLRKNLEQSLKGSFDKNKLDSNNVIFLIEFILYLIVTHGEKDILLKELDDYKLPDNLKKLIINTISYLLPDEVVMNEVESSNVHSVGYDKELKELYVKFKNGGFYKYFDVDSSQYTELSESSSVGGYLQSKIKPTKSYKKIK